MPPKRSGKGRKKAAESVKSVTITGNEDGSVRKNGEELRVDENEAPPPNGDVEKEKASMVPEAVGKRGRPKSKETKTIRSGDELNGNGEAIDPETEHSKNGHDEVDMDVNEDSSKKRGLRGKAPLQSMEIASESDVMTNTEQEGKTKIRAGRNARQTKERAPKKTKGERNAQLSSSEAACENLVSVEDLQADEEETKEIIPQETKESQNDEQLSADVKSVKDNSAPKKTRGRAAKHVTEEKDADKNAPQKTRNTKQSSNDIPGIISSLVDAEPKEMSSKGVRGRKRKNVQTEKGTEDVLATRIVKVSLLRQKSVDDMALEELKKSEVKVAAGMSNPRGKRGRKDDGDGGRLAKVSKASSSKLPKKTKIPDVSALDFGNTSTTASGESWNLKIVSWNINGIRAWLEKGGMSYLLHEQPDIVCFQETKCSENKLPEEVNVEGYHCYWLGGDKDGYSGVGLLSKKKPLSIEYGIGMENYDTEGRVITADYDKFYLVAAYVPNAGRALVRLDYRKQWDVDFRAYLKKLDQTKPVILCGDLNVAHQEIDLANPKSNKKNAGFTKEERDGFSALLSEGFVDTYRYLYPDTTSVYTFWTYMMNARAKNVGWRIDYFVMSERFADRLCDCCTRKDVMGSDHCPLVLFLCV